MSVSGGLQMHRADIKIKPRTEVDDHFKAPEDEVLISALGLAEIKVSIVSGQVIVKISTSRHSVDHVINTDSIIYP